MKHLTLVILLALAPLSWGEDVWYCVQKSETWIEFQDDIFQKMPGKQQQDMLTVKLHEETNEILVKSKLFTLKDDKPHRYSCTHCWPEVDRPILQGVSSDSEAPGAEVFVLTGDNYYLTGIEPNTDGSADEVAFLEAGTCTKF